MQVRAALRNLTDRLSVRQQIVAYGAFVTLVVAGAITLSTALVARHEATSTAQDSLHNLARVMGDRLDAQMAERLREIQNISGLMPLRNFWSQDPKAIQGVLEQVQASLPDYAWIGFATPDGTVRSATHGLLQGASVAARPWFQSGLHGPIAQDVHTADLLSKLLPASPDGAPFRFVDVAAPVYGADGKLLGVLGAHMSWTWAEDVRKALLATEDASTDVWVLAADRTVLLGPELQSTPFSAEQTESRAFVDQHGARDMLTSVVKTTGRGSYAGLGWMTVARQPVDVALEPARRLTGEILFWGGVLAVLGAGLAFALGRALSEPLLRLSREIDSIGRSTISDLSIEHGSAEIVSLSLAVRSLIRRIGSAEQETSEATRAALEARNRVEAVTRTAEEKTRRLGADIETLRHLAETDPLTGLLNRRAFLPFATDAMNYYRRYGRELGIVMLDIDRFKNVNDVFGHAAGDLVIKSVADAVAGQIRDTDKLARFGGEEFVVLLRECDAPSAVVLANRIRETIARTLVEIVGGPLQVTISAGVAIAGSTDRDIEDVIQRADKALYTAKNEGRNCVRLAPSLARSLSKAA